MWWVYSRIEDDDRVVKVSRQVPPRDRHVTWDTAPETICTQTTYSMLCKQHTFSFTKDTDTACPLLVSERMVKMRWKPTHYQVKWKLTTRTGPHQKTHTHTTPSQVKANDRQAPNRKPTHTARVRWRLTTQIGPQQKTHTHTARVRWRLMTQIGPIRKPTHTTQVKWRLTTWTGPNRKPTHIPPESGEG